MSTIDSLSKFLVSNRKPLFVFVLIILTVTFFNLGLPKYNGELGGLESEKNEEFHKLKSVDSTFRNGQSFYFLCAPKTNNTHEILDRIDSLSTSLLRIYPNARVSTPAPFFHEMRRYFGAKAEKWDHFMHKADSVPLLNQLIADDQKGFMIILSASENELIETKIVDSIAKNTEGNALKIELLSELHLTEVIGQTLASEMTWITGLILLLFTSYILFMIRNIRGILFMLFLIMVCLVSVPMLFSILEFQINVISIISLPIVLILVLGDSLHLVAGTNKYYEIENDSERMTMIVKRFIIPSFYSSLTTAFAFLSFYFFSESEFVRQFGLVTSLAVMLEFLITFLISPFLLYKTRISSLRDFNLFKFSNFLSKKRLQISIVLGALTILSLFIIPKLVIDASPDSYFPKNTPITERYNYFKTNYYEPLSINIVVKNTGDLSDSSRMNTYQKAYELNKKIQDIDYIKSVSSSADVFLFKNKMGITVNLFNHLNENDPFYNYENDEYLLDVKLKDLNKTGAFLDWLDKYPKQESIKITSASREKMLNEMTHSLTSTLMESLLTSGLGIFLIFLLLTRSIKLALLSLLPNLIPIGITLIFFYIFDFQLNLLTSLTLVISLGLLDDDTVHIIYRRLILKEEMEELTFSVISSALLLSIAFLIFALSNFEPLVVFGIICALIFMVGLISELVMFRWIIDSFRSKSKN